MSEIEQSYPKRFQRFFRFNDAPFTGHAMDSARKGFFDLMEEEARDITNNSKSLQKVDST